MRSWDQGARITDADDGAMTVTVARSGAEAARYVADWQALADRADEPNVFYEPWCLLPALDHFGAGRETRILLVHQSGQTGRRLAAVFPLERRSRLRGLPLPHLVAWRHPHLFFAQPLVDPSVAEQAWRGLLDWARRDGAWFVDLPEMPATGQTRAALQVASAGRCRVIDSYDRALLLRDAPNAQEYIGRASSPGSRKDWRRLHRRLSEQGQLEMRVLHPNADATPWIDKFLEMEALGWKGRNGTALASNAGDTAFFRTIATAAHARSALHMAGFFVDRRPVALQCNLFSQGHGSAFKVAFDETWAQFSPGVLLEVETIRDLFLRPGFVSMDSCTGRDHPLMSRVWSGVRRIERCRIATSAAGTALFALSPAMERLGLIGTRTA